MSADAAKAILDAITGGKGRIVYSCTLDDLGRTVGAPVVDVKRFRRTAEHVHANSICTCGEGARHYVRSCPARVRAVIARHR